MAGKEQDRLTDEAVALYEQAENLHRAGKLSEAEMHYRQLIRINRHFTGAYNNLGNVLLDLGRPEDAAVEYRKALKLEPDHPLLLNNLGNVLQLTGSPEKAIEVLTRAIGQKPDYADAYNNLGNALEDLGKMDEALHAYQKAVTLNPDSADIFNNIGVILHEQAKLDEAVASFQRALNLNPHLVEAYNNLGKALLGQLRLEEAMSSFRSAYTIDPHNAEAHGNLSLIQLLMENFTDGWNEYEWRRQLDWFKSDEIKLIQALPADTSYHDKHILVRAEQGLGDEIMFASCLPDILREARHVTIECDPRLAALYRRSFPKASVHSLQRGNIKGLKKILSTTDPIDGEIPIGSLPARYRKTPEDFPDHKGYLKADTGRTAFWRKQLDSLGAGLKIGISWRGGTQKTNMQARSLDLEQWLPILKLENTHFINLQYTPVEKELQHLQQQSGVSVHTWQTAIDDYDETAAMVCALDLIISVQTSLIHLAGALGQQAWVMVPYVPEWRYGLRETSMLWYPSVRLFRQKQSGDWSNVITGIRDELEIFTQRLPRSE